MEMDRSMHASSSSSSSSASYSRLPFASPPSSPTRFQAVQYPTISLSIRFASGMDDLQLQRLPATETIASIKQKVRDARQELANKTLRFVFSGRMLKDSSKLDQLLPDPVLNSSASSPTSPVLPFGKDSKTSPSRESSSRLRVTGKAKAVEEEEKSNSEDISLFLHCVVSEGPSSSEQEPQIGNGPSIGFDRLLEIGFTREEVDALRSQFHAMRGVDPNQTNADPSNPSLAARFAEDDWIDNRTPSNTTNPEGSPEWEQEGTLSDMLAGLLFGFFMGILVLLWMKEQGIFNRRQQAGILAGFLINISFGILRFSVSQT
ncbi:DUF2407 C-terminal domain-containing protein [Cladochytrium replicatum]|nr:DUF2407 C-terminal domain-containing protein [Cladochytrium replicatum]